MPDHYAVEILSRPSTAMPMLAATMELIMNDYVQRGYRLHTCSLAQVEREGVVWETVLIVFERIAPPLEIPR